jgi:Aspartyl/Asparaginyl beta-hydroxylase
MSLPDCLRLPFDFNPDLLRRDLEHLASTPWTAHFVRQNYEGDWSAIPLRAPAGETHPIRMIYPDPTCEQFVDTPFLHGCDYFHYVLAQFRCPLRNARLMRLSPGSIIKEHTDPDLSFEQGQVRLHIPVVTNDDVVFLLNRRRVDLTAGSTWYLRLSDPHAVLNQGATDRVHLVIDAVVDDWARQVFASAAARAAAAA